MKVNYSAQLMEESAFRHLNHLERSGYRADYDEFHSLADPIYELPEDDREAAFEKVNRLFFLERLKLGDHVLRALEAVGLIPKRRRTARKSALTQKAESGEIENQEAVEELAEHAEASEDEAQAEESETAVAEMEEDDELEIEEVSAEVSYDLAREFEERIKEVTVKRAINKVDEGSNVLNRVSGNPIIEMRVLASRFSNPEEAQELDAFLIQEFMHAKDMVDPEFDYEDAFIPGNPSVKNLITARFRLLWNMYVDSRLARMGVVSVLPKEARYREFDNFYRKIPEKQRKGIFEGLWKTEKLTHEELLSMATDLDTLMSKYVDPGEITDEDKDYIHLQGSPCPLCKFPTYNWVDDPESICDEMVIEAIQIDFPDWESRDGGCDRCIEVYELRAGVG
ncbi:MAG: hypothetical protein HN472_04320 [Nitrospina sp.]|jgi:hypothetical protein|nr:hypothetical protein [Nitrospina sp.]MBT3874615.1 hypothetical protein [Nitrospina sp.]MBT4047088.1 hypothetical protein [Nitrospina sp.]MBT4557890.1 hypothetical protein [Nitrospina sp.]MBT5349989.1 hypothetical protein [Nitrospina sp.]